VWVVEKLWSQEVEVAGQAARQAAELALLYQPGTVTETKPDHSPVTETKPDHSPDTEADREWIEPVAAIWDFAPLKVIVEEAGGSSIYAGNCIACTPGLESEVRKFLSLDR
jgi:3'-phosphoadenosine 5'-phosphosulfate (PAPS) 3'-phosphatase